MALVALVALTSVPDPCLKSDGISPPPWDVPCVPPRVAAAPSRLNRRRPVSLCLFILLAAICFAEPCEDGPCHSVFSPADRWQGASCESPVSLPSCARSAAGRGRRL